MTLLEINAKGGEIPKLLCKKVRYMLMQRGRYNQGGERISNFYLYRQGENTKVGGEKYVLEKNMLVSFDYSC